MNIIDDNNNNNNENDSNVCVFTGTSTIVVISLKSTVVDVVLRCAWVATPTGASVRSGHDDNRRGRSPCPSFLRTHWDFTMDFLSSHCNTLDHLSAWFVLVIANVTEK